MKACVFIIFKYLTAFLYLKITSKKEKIFLLYKVNSKYFSLVRVWKSCCIIYLKNNNSSFFNTLKINKIILFKTIYYIQLIIYKRNMYLTF